MKMHFAGEKGDLTLVLDVTLSAPRAAVWRCWTESALLKERYCPKPWRVDSADLDLKPGGRFNSVFAGPKGERHDNKGAFLEIETLSRLVFTDAYTEGFIPAGKHFMTGVVELSDEGAGATRMVWGARHGDRDSLKQHLEMGFEQGWRAAAQQLEDLAQGVDANGARHGATPLAPHLVVDGAAEAIEFYGKAFGAAEVMRLPGENGKIMHAAVDINGAMVMLVDENRDWGMLGPKALKGTPVTLHLTVANADAAIDRAAKAGAKVVMPAEDAFWGDRYGQVEDPFGHRWSIASPLRAMSPEEIQAAAAKAMPDYAKGE
jgi:uncharacterized glyoxalase superfamily protein PhnB/uncharacterized protein YndB with AHSA1/START domain